MKKILSATCAMMLASAGMMANAQQEQTQLPNGNFDGTWVDCKPDGSNVVGIQPEGWMASSVYKMGIKEKLVFQDNNREQSGDNAFSVRLENLWVGVKFLNMGANAPGYITLGTSWAYGDIANVGKPNDTSDGGAYGGIKFEYKPDALSLWVKRTHGTEKPTEKASVIFYSWKGQTSSEVITGLSSNPVKINMVDREKDVLGMIQDGVTKTDFELISTSENYIEGDITEWTQFTYPITYVSDGTPEKINVILSSSDYFDRSQLGKDNKFWVDDVEFVYYSTLENLSTADETLTLTDVTFDEEGVATFQMESKIFPTAESVSYTAKSQFATVDVEVLKEQGLVKVTVSNQGGKDVDGLTKHVYNLQYAEGTSGVESVAGDGVKVYAAAGCVVVEGAEGVAQVYTADGKQVAVESVNGKAEIALANGLYIVRVGNKVQKVVVK